MVWTLPVPLDKTTSFKCDSDGTMTPDEQISPEPASFISLDRHV